MKRIVLICTVACLLLSCAACGVTTAPEATVTPTAAPAESVQTPANAPAAALHSCESSCSTCGLCTDAACAEPVCENKCPGHEAETQIADPEDYITTAAVSVDTGTLVFDIGENVYVPGNLEEMGAVLAATMEAVTGLDFDGAGYSKDYYPDGKVHISIARDALYTEMDWYQGLKTSEVGNAYASSFTHVTASPGDLFLGHSKAVTHELAHVLMYRQTGWSHDQLLNEGFAEYTTYLVASHLAETAPGQGHYLDQAGQSIMDMLIHNYDALFAQPVEYWLENTFEYSGNQNYSIGFRFMAYLHEVYGDYSKWIPAFETKYNSNIHITDTGTSPVEQRVEVLKSVYGEDVFDNFYPWLKENLDRFDEGICDSAVYDLTGAEEISWYPKFTAIESTAKMERLQYKDLLIHIEPLRKYVREYKGFSGNDLQLETSEPVKVTLYYADGTSAAAETGVGDSALPMDGVTAIQLVGEGQLEWLEIVGDFRVLND